MSYLELIKFLPEILEGTGNIALIFMTFLFYGLKKDIKHLTLRIKLLENISIVEKINVGTDTNTRIN